MNYLFSPLSRLDYGDDVSRSSFVSSYDYDEEFELLVAAFLRDMDYTSVNQTSFNIIYAMINAGLVALPFAAYETGIPLFVFLIGFTSLLSAYTSVMVISMANEQKVRTLEDLAECAFGPRGFFAVCFFQILFSFSLMCITLDVYVDIMDDVFDGSEYAREGFSKFILATRSGQILMGSVFVLPLCILKTSMSSLRWTSYVTVFAVLAALIAVLATYITDRNHHHNVTSPDELATVSSPKKLWWFASFVSVFVFSCNQKMMTVYSSLRQRTVSRWQKAVKRAYIVLVCTYLIFGVFGYISKERLEDHMNNVNFFVADGDDVRKQIFDPARIALAISLLLTIPVDCLVATTTARRFYSKYMKFYYPNGHPVSIFIEKCIERVSPAYSLSHSSHNSYEQTIDNIRLTESEVPKIAATEHMPIPPARTSSRTMYNNNTISGVDISHAGSFNPPPAPASLASPARLTRKSKHIDAVARMRSLSQSHSHPLTSSGAANSYGESLSNPLFSRSQERGTGDIATRKISEGSSVEEEMEGVVGDDEGWSVYQQQALLSANLLGDGNGTTIEENKDNLDEVETSIVNERVMARRLPSHDHSRAYSSNQQTSAQLEQGAEGKNTLYGYLQQIMPSVCIYLLCLFTCLAITHWLYLAASVGTLSTAILLFVFPSILYFRLGLSSDYEAIPMFHNILPNQLYMHSIQIIGLVYIIFNSTLLCYFIYRGEHFVESRS